MTAFISSSPVRERIVGERGVYTKYNTVFTDVMTIKEYREMAESDEYKPPKFNIDDLPQVER